MKEVKNLEWKNIPDYGSLMTKKVWIDNVKSGGFIDYDGHGYYASETKMSNILVVPSDFNRRKLRKDKEFTHIMWFNR